MPEHWVGCEMKPRLPDGSIHRHEIVELALFDKEHKIVRGGRLHNPTGDK